MHQTRWMPFVALLLALGLAAAALAQEGGSAAPQGGAPEEPVTAEPVPDTPAQIVIEVPSQGGLGYNENGHLVVRAVLHNVGTQTAQPLDLIALVLNDCVLREVPQTCRFVAFGRFPAVGTEGIAPGTSLPITFDFGPVPDVDLSRSFILWHSVQ
ncbi:MAG: hypothetical protein LOD91_02620 [Limnochordales bacterium]|nr:hypothetical protein [Limnochordales bacterium]